MDIEDIPTSIEEAISRFIYAHMGDVDVRKRWRGAHALRLCGELHQPEIINNTIALYNRTIDQNFRIPSAPFYWISARTWLLIALDKIAVEHPELVCSHKQFLFEQALSETFPHIIIRELAKNTILALNASGHIPLSDEETEALTTINKNVIPRVAVEDSYKKGFDKHSFNDDERNGSFKFDSIGMLPDWYSQALRSFVFVSKEEFLNLAEKWIIKEWNVTGEPWNWKNEPRYPLRQGNKQRLTTTYNNPRPIYERFYYHIQFNAMWCATGDLLKNNALNQSKEEWCTIEQIIHGEIGDLSKHIWLTDIISPKPNEAIYWIAPLYESVKTWIDNITEEDFLREVGISSSDGLIKINSSTYATSNRTKYHCSLSSALISPITAASLVRMYQAERTGWDCLIPFGAGDNAVEMDEGDFIFKGWYRHTESRDSDIQKWNPLRYNVEYIQCEPAIEFLPSLDVSQTNDNITDWFDNSSKELAFTYKAWGDEFTGEDVENNYRHYGDLIDSRGWRLCVTLNYLQQFLSKCELDLIVLVEIEKENADSSYKDRITNKQHKLLLLRRDGTLENATGVIGTWYKNN
jgi:hypothetical protein